eukprot:8806793-Lingulodinium_polyedra.AAC.1
MRTPTLVFAWSARGVRFVSYCGGERQVQPHHCVAFCKRYAMTGCDCRPSQIARVARIMRTPKTGVRMERARRATFEPLRRRTAIATA